MDLTEKKKKRKGLGFLPDGLSGEIPAARVSGGSRGGGYGVVVRWGTHSSKRRAAGRPVAAAPSTACGGSTTASSAAPFPATTGSGEGGYGIARVWIESLGFWLVEASYSDGESSEIGAAAAGSSPAN